LEDNDDSALGILRLNQNDYVNAGVKLQSSHAKQRKSRLQISHSLSQKENINVESIKNNNVSTDKQSCSHHAIAQPKISLPHSANSIFSPPYKNVEPVISRTDDLQSDTSQSLLEASPIRDSRPYSESYVVAPPPLPQYANRPRPARNDGKKSDGELSIPGTFLFFSMF
jgi:hypothetical protein